MAPHHAACRDHSPDSARILRNTLAPSTNEAVFSASLNAILSALHDAPHVREVFPGPVEQRLRDLLGVARLTLYLRNRRHHSLVGRYRAGDRVSTRQVDFGPGSIVGFVAMTRQPVHAADVHCLDTLRAIHPHLRFDPGQDRELGSRSGAVCAVPVVSKGVLLGVLEAVNPVRGSDFPLPDLSRLQEVARFIGQKLRYDFRATCTPFEFLVNTGGVPAGVLEHLEREHQGRTASIARCLVQEVGLAPDLVGTSLERYYQVPFLAGDDTLVPSTAAIERLGRDELRANGLAVLQRECGRTVIAAENPNDTVGILEIQQALHLQRYDICVALRDDVLKYLEPRA